MKSRSDAARVAVMATAVRNNNQLELGCLVVQELAQYRASTAELAALGKSSRVFAAHPTVCGGVYRLAERLDLSDQDVTRLGWTKLALVAAASAKITTKRELGELCEGRTVTGLGAAMSGTAGVVKTFVFTQ